MIKVYHNSENGKFNISDFMEELLKKQQNMGFIGASTSHKNGAEEHAIKMVVTMKRTKLV